MSEKMYVLTEALTDRIISELASVQSGLLHEEWFSNPTTQAPVVPSGQQIAEALANALMGIKWHECGVLTGRMLLQDAEKIRAHLLTSGYREQSEGMRPCCATCIHRGIEASSDGFHHCKKFAEAEKVCFGNGYCHWEAASPPSNSEKVREAVEEIEKWSVVGKMTEQGMREALGYINTLSNKALAALSSEVR